MESIRTRISFFLFFLFLTSAALSQDKKVSYYIDPSATPPDLPVTIRHLTAWVSFQPEQNMVTGTAEFIFTPNRHQVDAIVFYTPDFRISSVTINGAEVVYNQPGSNLVVYPVVKNQDTRSMELGTGGGKSVTAARNAMPVIHSRHILLSTNKEGKIKIVYTAKPRAGAIYFIGWREEEEGKRKQIWAHRPHGWLPYMEGRITVDMNITFESDYMVFSNGERVGIKENPDHTKTWHYRMTRNHPFFSTSLVIGDYEFRTSQTKRGIPLEFWYYRGMENKVEPTYRYTEQMFDVFEKEMGVNYPYPLYREAPVIDYMYGAMETTTATVFGDFMLIEPRAWWQRNYVNVNAHELAHQWFGNYICHQVNKDVWLTESFGTYYAKIFEKSIYGEDYYQNIRLEELALTMEAAERNDYPVGGTRGGVERIYRKGSLVLDMLRYVMGDREFRDAIQHYLKTFGFTNTRTSDFIQSVYVTGKKPYDWFFEEWILHGGEPNYTVKYVEKMDSSGIQSVCIWVWQTQEINDQTGLFRMPIEFEVHYGDGTSDKKRVWIAERFNEVIFSNPERKTVDFVLFDPNRQILKKVVFDKSFEELSSQALKADNMIDRYDALLALQSIPVEKKRELLVQCYRKETFFLTKAEIIRQLANEVNNPGCLELFREGLTDKDANVRKAVLAEVSPLPETIRREAEECLSDSSWLNIEYALRNLCNSFPLEKKRYLEKTRDLEGWRGKNVRMIWLEMAIGSGDKKYLEELIPYTGPKYEFETRINALNLLKRLRYADEKTLDYALQASKHWNNKLSKAGKDYLEFFGKK
jgi:aminopeptidase N